MTRSRPRGPVTLEARVARWLDRLQQDEAARTRLFRILWLTSTAVTVLGFVIIAIVLSRQGIL